MIVAEQLNEFFASIANKTLAQAVYDGMPVKLPPRLKINGALTLWPTTQNEKEEDEVLELPEAERVNSVNYPSTDPL
ncbi:hypothetical protein J6590_048744 [Homalodisca vitripennis]|nr:hypothetical protein J6590_048744 [Homalodisca vitripennis]